MTAGSLGGKGVDGTPVGTQPFLTCRKLQIGVFSSSERVVYLGEGDTGRNLHM